ncbi:MAG: hypothetical protein AAB527_02530 [Patescibacteria group bacterium]
MRNSKRAIFLALAIFLVAGFFRFWELKSVPPGLYPDEAMNGNNALFALKTGDFSSFYPENNGREGLFINMQAGALSAFGNEPWALRFISAIFGTLTVLGIFYLGRELFRNFAGVGHLKIAGLYSNEIIALVASFFTAISFWHINFSRIGFRAIMAPFFLVWGLYFLWLLFREDISESGKSYSAALGGFVFGLGANSYIAYRVAPILLAIPLLKILKNKGGQKQIAIFLLLALAAFLPLGFYYFGHPQDFLGRTSQVSIFSESDPLKSFLINSAKSAGSFWFSGDWNPRHNLPGAPQLWWPVGILFALGLILSVLKYRHHLAVKILWLWLFIFALPVVLSSEGIPHALRSIIMIPAIMFFAGMGFLEVLTRISGWLDSQLERFPEKNKQITRIKFELILLVSAFFAAGIITAYTDYFMRWANLTDTYFAFNANYTEIGRWLNLQPSSVKKYVVVNAAGVQVAPPDDILGEPMPMPAQTIMFLTDTWPQSERIKKNIYYILPQNLSRADCAESCFLIPLEYNAEIALKIKKNISGLTLSVRAGFPVFYKGSDIR